MLLTTTDLLRLCGLGNPKTIYTHILKGRLKGRKRSRVDGGLDEWVFEEAEANRFADWIKSTTPAQRRSPLTNQ